VDTETTMDPVDTDAAAAQEAARLPALTVHERCDASDCSAQAYVRVLLRSGRSLVFCGHHGHALVPVLAGQGAVMRDDTHVLVEDRLRITPSLGSTRS